MLICSKLEKKENNPQQGRSEHKQRRTPQSSVQITRFRMRGFFALMGILSEVSKTKDNCFTTNLDLRSALNYFITIMVWICSFQLSALLLSALNFKL